MLIFMAVRDQGYLSGMAAFSMELFFQSDGWSQFIWDAAMYTTTGAHPLLLGFGSTSQRCSYAFG